jgi:23S rRNA (guanine745-N1)-methyltransferase
MVTVLCPVRGCGVALARAERSWRCARGHVFDVSRSGYCNLLQPQDSRSREPGDPKDAALARRRFLEAGHGAPLLPALLEEMADLPPRPAVLDVGCGEGFWLAALAAAREIDGHGVDLSVPAIDLAARSHPGSGWWVVNADRGLPFADGSFDLVLSITARRPAAELRRVLAPEGRLLVAVPGDDDLAELREAVLGEPVPRGRLEKVAEELAPFFELEQRRTVRRTEDLSPAALGDALAATYRAGRESRARKLAGLPSMRVTSSLDLGRFRRLESSLPSEG